MTLTPVPLPIPPHLRGKQPAAGDSVGGMLMPLPVGGADSRARLQALLGAMCGDLLGRVLLDRWALATLLLSPAACCWLSAATPAHATHPP
jgi:hypothetical protein